MSQAPEQLQALAEYLNVPVCSTFIGKGALSARHPLHVGIPGCWGEERAKHPNTVPYLVAITDGRGTVPLRPGGDAHEDALRRARHRIGVLVADAAAPGSPEALAGRVEELATAARGRCVPFRELAA